MIGSGTFKVDLEGRQVGFQFGTLAGAYTEEKSGISIFEIFNTINGKGKNSTRHLLNYFWGAAMAYREINGIEGEVTTAEVSQWMDEMGITKTFQIYIDSVKMPVIKNGKAPKAGPKGVEV
jgi:hypothetical protein